jgi:hypothetical protein
MCGEKWDGERCGVCGWHEGKQMEQFNRQMKNLNRASWPADKNDEQDVSDTCDWAASRLRYYRERDAAALRQPPAPEPPAIVALAWEDGWRQRHALHNAALGIRILEKPRRLDAFLTSNGLPAMPKRTGPIDGRALMDAAFDDAQPDTRGDPR